MDVEEPRRSGGAAPTQLLGGLLGFAGLVLGVILTLMIYNISGYHAHINAPTTTPTAFSSFLTIIHLNDVYAQSSAISAAAHFVESEKEANPGRTLALFAGDLLSPSPYNEIFEG